MMILHETGMTGPATVSPSNAASTARVAVPAVLAVSGQRRSRQDWLAEAMQCLCYENLSARRAD